MSYSTYGAGAAVVLVAAIGIAGAGDRSANWAEARATITTIDRKCEIVETRYDQNYRRKGSRVYTDSCSSLDDWDKVRAQRTKTVAGTAVVHLTYSAPQNGRYETGELTFDGRDDEFYQLKAGDEIEISVSKSDPTKIRRA